MALDSTQIFVAGTGDIYVGPVGTAAPTDVTTAVNAAFLHSGYQEEDGATFGVSYDTDPKKSWQALDPTNYVRTGRASTFKHTVKQWNQQFFPIVHGGGAMTETSLGSGVFKYDAPSGATIDYRALVMHVTDGTKIGRLHIPKAMLTDVSEVQFARGEEAVWECTWGVIATGAAAAFTWLGNVSLYPATS